MESLDSSGGSRLLAVTELSHIKELAKQLEEQLGGSRDLCKHLASQIFSLTERSIGIITCCSDFGGARKRSATDAGLAAATPGSLGQLADAPFKTTKKRKMMEKMKSQVRVSSGGGCETPVDDGRSWRKYGQKEILGAKYPRAYYRCTHRHTQGCAATKQVQRTDEDPELFDVFYVGAHTCRVHNTVADKAASATPPPDQHDPDAHSLQHNLTVKTEEGLAVAGEPQGWEWDATAPFGMSATPASLCLAAESCPFSAPSTSDNRGVLSPASSELNHAPSFPTFDAGEWWAQSELQGVVSALVVAGTPPAPDCMDGTDELLDDFDVSFFLA